MGRIVAKGSNDWSNSFLNKDPEIETVMATIAVFKSSFVKPSLCRFASTVNSAIFQKYGNPANVLR